MVFICVVNQFVGQFSKVSLLNLIFRYFKYVPDNVTKKIRNETCHIESIITVVIEENKWKLFIHDKVPQESADDLLFCSDTFVRC